MKMIRSNLFLLMWLVTSVFLVDYGLLFCLTDYLMFSGLFSTVIGVIMFISGCLSYYRFYNHLLEKDGV